LRWASHQESRLSQVRTCGKPMPVMNGALNTGMKPSSCAEACQCLPATMLQSCFPAGVPSTATTLSMSTEKGGPSCIAFPSAPVNKEMAQGLQRSIRGLQSLAERSRMMRAVRLSWQPDPFSFQKSHADEEPTRAGNGTRMVIVNPCAHSSPGTPT